MIKRFAKFMWDVMIEIGQARHERMKRGDRYAMWY
jgi:hypothetical protein